MNTSCNKRKNNNNNFDKSPENFQINMNNINNLGNCKYAKDHKKSLKRRNQKCRTGKSRSKNRRRETSRITKGKTKR